MVGLGAIEELVQGEGQQLTHLHCERRRQTLVSLLRSESECSQTKRLKERKEGKKKKKNTKEHNTIQRTELVKCSIIGNRYLLEGAEGCLSKLWVTNEELLLGHVAQLAHNAQ